MSSRRRTGVGEEDEEIGGSKAHDEGGRRSQGGGGMRGLTAPPGRLGFHVESGGCWDTEMGLRENAMLVHGDESKCNFGKDDGDFCKVCPEALDDDLDMIVAGEGGRRSKGGERRDDEEQEEGGRG